MAERRKQLSDFEPYVRDAAEPAPPSAFDRFRPLIVVLLVAVALGMVVLVVQRTARQDPALLFPAASPGATAGG